MFSFLDDMFGLLDLFFLPFRQNLAHCLIAQKVSLWASNMGKQTNNPMRSYILLWYAATRYTLSKDKEGLATNDFQTINNINNQHYPAYKRK